MRNILKLRNSITMALHFNLKTPSLDTSFIFAIGRYKGKKFVLSTGEKIPVKYWNPDKERARNHQAFKDSESLNAHLDTIEGQYKELLREYKAQRIIPTGQEFKERLRARIEGEVKDETIPSLFDFIEQYTAAKNVKSSTKQNYSDMLNVLKNYSKDRKIELDYESITLDFYFDFLNFMYSPLNNYSVNTAGKHIKNLKLFMGEAMERDYHQNTAFKNKRFQRPNQQTHKVYLTELELKAMYNLDLSENLTLDKARDLFLVGAYTGLRFSDFSTIKPENIRTIYDHEGKPFEVLRITTKKTTEAVIIPLRPVVKEILQKYDNRLPKAPSNLLINRRIKKIAELCNIDETIQLTKSEGGKAKTIVCKKYEVISTHTARRSFATNAFKARIPSLSIMKITGHKTEKAFLQYIRLSNEENAILMAKTAFFSGDGMLKAV